MLVHDLNTWCIIILSMHFKLASRLFFQNNTIVFIGDIQVTAIMEPFDWLVVEMSLKVEWRSAMEDFGEQYVICGELKMLKLSVISWVT